MCGVNQFCIIVFFAAVKPANNILFCIELIHSGGQSEASWNTEAVEANVSRLRNISTPVSTVTPSGHFQVLLWNSVDKETIKRIDEL